MKAEQKASPVDLRWTAGITTIAQKIVIVFTANVNLLNARQVLMQWFIEK